MKSPTKRSSSLPLHDTDVLDSAYGRSVLLDMFDKTIGMRVVQGSLRELAKDRISVRVLRRLMFSTLFEAKYIWCSTQYP